MFGFIFYAAWPMLELEVSRCIGLNGKSYFIFILYLKSTKNNFPESARECVPWCRRWATVCPPRTFIWSYTHKGAHINSLAAARTEKAHTQGRCMHETPAGIPRGTQQSKKSPGRRSKIRERIYILYYTHHCS